MPRGVKRQLEDAASSASVRGLLHTGHVSITGLSSILKHIRGSSAEIPVSRTTLSKVNLERFLSLRFVENVPLVDGGEWPWEYADPCKLLEAVVEHKRSLQDLYTRAVAESPPSLESPWSLVVAYDEFSPGNKLQPDNRRKTMVLSFTFKELGQVALCNGTAWLVPVCIRQSHFSQLQGGWSNLLRLFLTRILLGPGGLATSGTPLQLADGRTVLLFARLTNLLSDGEGLKVGLDWKGHGGLKPCFKHYNILKKDLNVEHVLLALVASPQLIRLAPNTSNPGWTSGFRFGHSCRGVRRDRLLRPLQVQSLVSSRFCQIDGLAASRERTGNER